MRQISYPAGSSGNPVTLEGFRVEEVLGMHLDHYNAAKLLIQPSRSKRKQAAVAGHENKLRTVRLSDKTVKVLNDYLFA